jgi:hypothetical protein
LILLNAVLGWIANFYQIWIWATARQDLIPIFPRILDHIIVTKKGYFSFQEAGLIG